jgi:hypothetical protein
MRTYTPMNYNVVALIRQDPIYKRMTSDNVFRMIINHEMHIEEVVTPRVTVLLIFP